MPAHPTPRVSPSTFASFVPLGRGLRSTSPRFPSVGWVGSCGNWARLALVVGGTPTHRTHRGMVSCDLRPSQGRQEPAASGPQSGKGRRVNTMAPGVLRLSDHPLGQRACGGGVWAEWMELQLQKKVVVFPREPGGNFTSQSDTRAEAWLSIQEGRGREGLKQRRSCTGGEDRTLSPGRTRRSSAQKGSLLPRASIWPPVQGPLTGASPPPPTNPHAGCRALAYETIQTTPDVGVQPVFT